MKAEVYITINWNGPYNNGEAAVAIVMLAEGCDQKFLKIYGFSHLSYPHAGALGALRMIKMVKPGTELAVHVEDTYTAMMMRGENKRTKAHKELWREFHEAAGHIDMTVIRDRNHQFKTASIRATEKGGYRMEEIGGTYGKEKG